jgi:hypothetical protein
MRNKLFILILTLAVAACLGTPVFADVTILGGADLMGSWEVSGDGGSEDGDTDTGFFLGGEFSTSISPLVSLGGGLRYQFERQDADEEGDAAWNFIPIYGLVHLNFPAAFADFFAAGQIGYNIFMANDDLKGDADTSGGVYWGIGGGLKLPMGLQFELLYNTNNGALDFDGGSVDLTTSYLSLSVGFNF